jgi:hypothetical protein
MYTQFWSEGLKERDHLEDLGIDGSVIFDRILEKHSGNVWNGFKDSALCS